MPFVTRFLRDFIEICLNNSIETYFSKKPKPQNPLDMFTRETRTKLKVDNANEPRDHIYIYIYTCNRS